MTNTLEQFLTDAATLQRQYLAGLLHYREARLQLFTNASAIDMYNQKDITNILYAQLNTLETIHNI